MGGRDRNKGGGDRRQSRKGGVAVQFVPEATSRLVYKAATVGVEVSVVLLERPFQRAVEAAEAVSRPLDLYTARQLVAEMAVFRHREYGGGGRPRARSGKATREELAAVFGTAVLEDCIVAVLEQGIARAVDKRRRATALAELTARGAGNLRWKSSGLGPRHCQHWSIETNGWMAQDRRDAVVAVLLVGARIASGFEGTDADDGGGPVSPCADRPAEHRIRSPVVRTSKQKTLGCSELPYLPNRLWILVLSFVKRSQLGYAADPSARI